MQAKKTKNKSCVQFRIIYKPSYVQIAILNVKGCGESEKVEIKEASIPRHFRADFGWRSGFWVSRITEKETIITKSALDKIIQTSELSTAEFVNNSVLTVYNEKKPEKVDYYVLYESTISVGIDLREIQVDESDMEKKEITVRIPMMRVNDIEVDEGSLDYIFNDEDFNTTQTAFDAYKKC